MSQRDVILSMIEAVSCTLNQTNDNEISQAEQFDIVLRAIPFFNEILSMVNSTTARQLIELRDVVSNFLKCCNRCMIYISKEASLENLNLLIDFLNSLISSCLVSECIDSMSQLLVVILNTRDIPKERASLFSKIFKTFFEASDLRSEFIKCDGILSAWFTYVAEPENPLILEVFLLFQKYLEFFALPDFLSHITDLIAAVSASFASLSLNSANFIFTIIQEIVAFNPKLFIQKLDENLFFQSIYLFIIQHQDNDPNLISYLEFFTTLIPFSSFNRNSPTDGGSTSSVKIPSLDMTINIISSMECKVPLRHRALEGIVNILRYITKDNMPFTTDQIAMIANAIPIDDPESVYTLSTICLDLNIQANFDISPLIPFLQRFMTIDLLLKIDMTKYISLFLEYQAEVAPFVPALYISIFQKLTPELFSEIANRYGHLFAFFAQHFEEPLKKDQLEQIMKLLIVSFPYYRDVGGAESCLSNIIVTKKGYIFTKTIFETIEEIASLKYDFSDSGTAIPTKEIETKSISSSISSSDLAFKDQKTLSKKRFNEPYDVSGLLRILTKTLKDSYSFRAECILQEIFLRVFDYHTKFGITGNVILDFISALTNHIYIPSLDAAVYVKLKEKNFMGMDKHQLLRFALGLQQTEKTANINLSETKGNEAQPTSNDISKSNDNNNTIKDNNGFDTNDNAKFNINESNSNSLINNNNFGLNGNEGNSFNANDNNISFGSSEKVDNDSRQHSFLSFLDEDQSKEIPINEDFDGNGEQSYDQPSFKPFESSSMSKLTISDLNDGFTEGNNLSDQNSTTNSGASLRAYSSSFTAHNTILNNNKQDPLFNLLSKTSSYDDNSIPTGNKSEFSSAVTATSSSTTAEAKASMSERKVKFDLTDNKAKKKSHNSKHHSKSRIDQEKQASTAFPQATLCFPSILGHCDDYVFTSRYDLWICGRVGLTAWLRDSGRPISEFPSIINIASQYARLEHLEMLLDYPKIFYQTCTKLTKLPPLFEFKKTFNCSFDISPSSQTSTSPFLATPGFTFQHIKSFCFWFQAAEVSSDLTSFLTINSSIKLFLGNYEILYENNVISTFEISKWIFFAATSDQQSPTTINIYLDMKLVYKLQSKNGFTPAGNSKSNISFGGKKCHSTWFIGGTIRFFSEPVTTDVLNRIYSSGVSSTLSTDQLNINANNKSQPFETIRKSATMSAPLFGGEDYQEMFEDPKESETTKYIRTSVHYANIINGGSLNRKERPVSIYSLLNYIQNVKSRPAFIVRRAIEFVHKNDYENANYLLKSLCYLKKNKIFKQSNDSFSFAISTLFHMAPNILTDDTIDMIIECYERNSRLNIINKDKTRLYADKNVGYDWNSFFIFAFDYSLMFSNHAVVFISKFFELNARYPIIDDMSRYSFTLYLFSLLSIPEFDHSLNESILDFIMKLAPDTSLLFFLLTSYPKMAIAMTVNSEPYSFDEDDNNILLILNLISNLRIKGFNYYLLLTVLPSAMSSKLVRTLAEQNLKTIYQQQNQGRSSRTSQNMNNSIHVGSVQQNYSIFSMNNENFGPNYHLESLDYNEIFDSLLYNVFMPESWFSAISICTNSLNVDDLHNINLNHFDMNLFVPFFKMFTLLSCACFRMSEDSFWIRFAALLSEQMILIIPSIPEKIVTRTLKFWVLQLMTFGQPFDKMSSFPPYPLAFASKDILEYIVRRGQEYPKIYGKPFTFQPVSFPFNSSKNSNQNQNSKVYNEMLEQVYKYVEFVSPKEFCLNGVAKYHLHNKRHHKIFKEIFDSNVTYVAKDWVEFINNIIVNFGLDPDFLPVKEHPLTDILIRLLSTFVVHCPSLFHTIFNTMSIFPNDLMMILVHKITVCSLNLCEHQKIFHQQLIDIACKRALEGWYTNQYVNVIHQIFRIVNQCFFSDSNSSSNANSSNLYNLQLPISFYNAIIFGLDLIPINDVPKLMNLVISNRNIVVTQSFVMNFDLCLTFVAKIIQHINILPAFYQLWSYFISVIKSIDQFQIQWNKTYAQQSKLIGSNQNSQNDIIEYSTLISFMNFFEKNGADGVNKLKKEKSDKYLPLEKLLQNTMNSYHQQVLNEMATEIDSLMKTRNDVSVEFIRHSNGIIIDRSKKVTCDKAKAGCLRQIFREYFIFMNLFFIRRRENYISTVFPINFNKKKDGRKRKSITILTDPIYPSRRLEVSPLGYNIPSFPDGNYRELFPEDASTLPVFDDINYSSAIRELFSYSSTQLPFLLRYSPYQIHAMFTQSLPIQPYQNLTLLSLLINKGCSFQYTCNCSLLYGIETLNGCLFLCENCMYFAEGFKIDEDNKNNGFTFVEPSQSLAYFFYLQSIMTKHFGRFSLYQGHPIIEWPLEDIIGAYPHIWIHKPYSIALNFVRGFNFVLNFKKSDYDYLFPILKRHSSSFFDSAPPTSAIHTVLSTINSARYLQLSNKEVTNKWQNGEIDTFTYLCILNRFGKRPTCDMTQYPVFPWIISDFDSSILNLYNDNNNEQPKNSNFRDLSLPMGQIGKKRSERFNEFYKDTNNQYYYGTHYMHYGVVLYFTFRVDPFTFFSIELNKGWDHPNRVFYNLSDSWMSAAYNSPTDLKEVIPQFFLVPEIFDNISNLPLTTNDDGISIESVKLPNWANNAREMSDILLKLMQSDYVQKNINHWIDLIFGDKSRGQNARDAKNLFHPLCYAPVRKHRDISGTEDGDLESLEDDVSREASIISIINFGQCPQQVMNKAHPQIKYSKYWRILSSPIIAPSVASSLESITTILPAPPASAFHTQEESSATQNSNSSVTTTSSSSSQNNLNDLENNQQQQQQQQSSVPVPAVVADGNSSLMMFGEMISNAQMSLTSNWQRLRSESFLMPPYSCYCDNTNVVLTSNHKISAFVPQTGQFLYVEDNAVMLTNKNQSESYKLSDNDMFMTASAAAFSSDGFYLLIALRDGSLMLYKMTYVKGEARYPKLLHVFSAYNEEYAEENEEDEEENEENISLGRNSSSDSVLSSSCTFRIPFKPPESYIEKVHDIVSVCISSEHFIAFAASRNRVIQFDIGLYSNMPSITLDFMVRKVELDDPAALLFAVGDNQIAVITISGEVLIQRKINDYPITCITTSKLPQYFTGRFLATGHSNGRVSFWKVSYRQNKLQRIGWVKLSEEPIISVALSSNSQRMIAGTKNEVFSCECQNIGGGFSVNMINAIRVASRIREKKKRLSKAQKHQQQEENLESSIDQQQKELKLHENDDGFVVIDVNKSNASQVVGFKSKTTSIPFISAAIGSTGGSITGAISSISGGSGSGNSVSCIPLKKETYATECAACHADIKKNAFVCMKCGRFFCQKCITKEISALKTSITCVQCMTPQTNPDANPQSVAKIVNE
ncbi:hypothetical protein M9Y10_000977 [Tritrichomonas musculus]|uniref:Beige/BEACH domain containing protein n=1 Tax=Tritrichomonas musculus TaxID=1915356 RepID=A0ABR2L8V5_9EUKA